MIQNEDEKLNEDAAAQVGEVSNLGDPVVATSSSEMKASLGAVAKRTSPRNKQKPRTDRLGRKPTSKTGPVLSSVLKDFSREGQEVCDFVRHLHHDVLETLFSYLSGHDLYRVAQVRSILFSLSSFLTFFLDRFPPTGERPCWPARPTTSGD